MHGSEGFFLELTREREREREREGEGFFLELTIERVYWKMKNEGNEKAKWRLGQNNRGIHWTKCEHHT